MNLRWGAAAKKYLKQDHIQITTENYMKSWKWSTEAGARKRIKTRCAQLSR